MRACMHAYIDSYIYTYLHTHTHKYIHFTYMLCIDICHMNMHARCMLCAYIYIHRMYTCTRILIPDREFITFHNQRGKPRNLKYNILVQRKESSKYEKSNLPRGPPRRSLGTPIPLKRPRYWSLTVTTSLGRLPLPRPCMKNDRNLGPHVSQSIFGPMLRSQDSCPFGFPEKGQ